MISGINQTPQEHGLSAEALKRILAVIGDIGEAIRSAGKDLGNGNAATDMGAIEAHGLAIKDAGSEIAGALSEVATAIREATRVWERHQQQEGVEQP